MLLKTCGNKKQIFVRIEDFDFDSEDETMEDAELNMFDSSDRVNVQSKACESNFSQSNNRNETYFVEKNACGSESGSLGNEFP